HRLRGPPCTSTGWHRHYLRDGGPDGKRPGTSLHRAWGDAQMVHRLALGGAAERLLAAEGVRYTTLSTIRPTARSMFITFLLRSPGDLIYSEADCEHRLI